MICHAQRLALPANCPGHLAQASANVRAYGEKVLVAHRAVCCFVQPRNIGQVDAVDFKTFSYSWCDDARQCLARSLCARKAA